MPISATFILFDFIIHDPTHDKTRSNLSLLGIAAGYFCSLEYASGGALQTSLLSDIAHIARDYIHNVDRGDVVRRTDSIREVGSSQHADVIRTELQTPVSIDTVCFQSYVTNFEYSPNINLPTGRPKPYGRNVYRPHEYGRVLLPC